MTKHRIEFRPRAVRDLKRLAPPDRDRAVGAISLLAAEPRPPAARRLKGRPAWRLRVGDYRVIYAIEDGALLVLVIAVGHRRDVYDR